MEIVKNGVELSAEEFEQFFSDHCEGQSFQYIAKRQGGAPIVACQIGAPIVALSRRIGDASFLVIHKVGDDEETFSKVYHTIAVTVQGQFSGMYTVKIIN